MMLAGVAILWLATALGYGDRSDPDGVHWIELAIYLCAAIIVAAEFARLIPAPVGSPGRPAQGLQSRFGKEQDTSSR